VVPSHQGMEELSDAEVMLQAQWGSERAFAELYARHYRRLLDFFYGLSRDVQTAEDLCHETFLRLWQLRARYRPSGSFPAYLFTIARHIWMERRRQTRKEWRLGTAWSADDGADAVVVDIRLGPDEQARLSELDERIFAALDNLPEEQRMAFILRTVEDMSLEDIAEVMQCPVNTVRSRRLLAIKRLREVLRGLLSQESLDIFGDSPYYDHVVSSAHAVSTADFDHVVRFVHLIRRVGSWLAATRGSRITSPLIVGWDKGLQPLV